MLFVVGMRIVVQDGIDYRKGLVAGVAFWVGVGFQNDVRRQASASPRLCRSITVIGNRARAARSPEAARTAALPISAFCPVFSGAFTVRFVTFSPSSGGHCSSPTRRSCAVFSRELGWMARRGDPRGPSNAHVRVHVGGALCHVVPRSAKWGRLVRRFWPVFGTLTRVRCRNNGCGVAAKRWRAMRP